jgi:AGZA family xanthine/uracil permease-like MFS transporter
MSTSKTFKPKLWTPGDWNAFFGFGTNILVNMLVLTGLLRFVLKMPDALVFGRILPALGLMMCLSTFYYAWLGYSLAKKTGRSDVCAMPSGVSVPHMFIVTFVIMLPITLTTKDPVKGWEAFPEALEATRVSSNSSSTSAHEPRAAPPVVSLCWFCPMLRVITSIRAFNC